MGNWQSLLDLLVALLLAATLLRARRLDRALAALRQDRSALDGLVAGFDAAAAQARSAVAALRDLADAAGRRLEQQTAAGIVLRDDLSAVTERAEALLERLDHGVRAVRAAVPQAVAPRPPPEPEPEGVRVRSKAERDLLLALQGAR